MKVVNFFLTKIRQIVPWLLRGFLFLAIPYSFYVQDFLFIFGAVSALVFSLLPAYWARNLKVNLPLGLDFFVTLALFLHIVLGEILKFYDHVWFFDKFMHFYGTGIIALLAFVTVFTFHWTKKITLSLPLIAYFTIIFSMAVGTFWEIGEFLVDQIFLRNTQYSLTNTMWDLIFNFFGGITAAIFGVVYTGRKEYKNHAGLVRSVRKIFKF